MEIPLLETIILFLIDADRNSTHMSRSNWLKVYDRLSKFMSLIETNDIIVHEGVMVDAAFRPAKEEVEVPSYISGFYMTLDEEWTKGLQFTDPHTLEFRQRLRDEVLLMDICERIYDYYKRKEDSSICADILSRAYDHFYYRRQRDFEVFRTFWKNYEGLSAYDRKYDSLINTEDVRSLLRTFRREIEAVIAETDIAFIKTILETTYHYSISDVYTRAKELISHHRVQDFFAARLSDAEIPLQVLYNRVILQLGLSAFRSGKIQEAYTLLGDLASNSRLKELIAQRTSLGKIRHESPEIERILRSRLVPFHMQIHVEEVEMVHQICCLLLELPTIAKNPFSGRRNLVSRTFARVLQQSRRHVFVTPPEHIKDFVYAASVSLKVGDWNESLRYLFSMKIWEGMYRSEDVKKMLSQQVKEVALRVYLLEYVGSYLQLDVNVLSSMFELSRDRTNAILCRMITDDEIPGSYTEADSSLVSCRSSDMEETNYLAAQLAEKVRTFLDMNERMANPHHRADDDRRGGHDSRRQTRPRGKRM
jgi:translation initiation factor 3 subunit C